MIVFMIWDLLFSNLRFIPRESTQPVVPEQHQEAGLQEMEHIFLFHVYIYIYFMLHFFCFCNGILAVPDVDISLCRRFAVLILTLLPPKSGLDCSFFKMVLAFGQDYFGEQVLFFFSIPTLKSESQPLYGNTVWDRKQRKHKKKQNQTNKNVKKNKNNPKVRNSSIHSAPAAAATA